MNYFQPQYDNALETKFSVPKGTYRHVVMKDAQVFNAMTNQVLYQLVVYVFVYRIMFVCVNVIVFVVFHLLPFANVMYQHSQRTRMKFKHNPKLQSTHVKLINPFFECGQCKLFSALLNAIKFIVIFPH